MQAQLIFYLLCPLLVFSGCNKVVPVDKTDLYPVKIGKQYGYINAAGKVVIEPKFFSVNWFSGNRAIVETAPGRKAMIDRDGSIVFQDTTGFLYLDYQDGLVKFETEDKKNCFVDSLGNLSFCLSDTVVFAESAFSCERLLVRLSGSVFAYLDTEGKEVYRFKRGFPDNYKEDIVRRTFKGRTCYFDKSGKSLFCVKGRGSDFSNNLARIEEKGNGYFIDREGKKQWKKLPSYDLIMSFVEGFAMVKRKEKFGFIDTEGKEVIACIYDQSGFFSGDVVAVRQDKNKDKWKFVNSRNEQVITTEFDEVVMPGFRDELAYVRQGSTWGYINKTGAFVWKVESIQKND